MDFERLAVELATCANRHLPEVVHLDVTGRTITFSADRRLYALGGTVEFDTSNLSPGIEPDEELRLTCRSFLNALQDFIAESIGEPWPAAAGPMPMPQVTLTPTCVHLSYDVPSGPVLVLGSLDRTALE